jgi:hypothetical protein
MQGGRPTRSHLKKRILVKYRGGAKFQPAGILRYFEELKRGTNKEIGPKDIFEIASITFVRICLGRTTENRRLQIEYLRCRFAPFFIKGNIGVI